MILDSVVGGDGRGGGSGVDGDIGRRDAGGHGVGEGERAAWVRHASGEGGEAAALDGVVVEAGRGASGSRDVPGVGMLGSEAHRGLAPVGGDVGSRDDGGHGDDVGDGDRVGGRGPGDSGHTPGVSDGGAPAARTKAPYRSKHAGRRFLGPK